MERRTFTLSALSAAVLLACGRDEKTTPATSPANPEASPASSAPAAPTSPATPNAAPPQSAPSPTPKPAPATATPAPNAGPVAFVAGNDYRVLKQRAPVEAGPGKIEVVEFFWYSCPHCNAFEPELNAWLAKLPPQVEFKRIPVRFRADFGPQQRLYYTLEAMGQLGKLHAKVFHAIHVERNPLNTDPAIFDWVAAQGLDRAAFESTFNSFTVVGKAKRATQLQEAYQVEGVPALGVAGRYYLDGTLAQGMSRALQVVNHLITLPAS